jgi:hypothetical protein
MSDKKDPSGADLPPESLIQRTEEWLGCAEWEALHRKYYNCRDCNAPIYFDDKHISKNDKHIPLSKVTGEPHQCEEASPKA